MRMRLLAVLALAASLLSGCGYNQIQINDEAVTAAWSEVLNQYKRRADLIPNLVSVVQGYAGHEKDVLTRVTEARANVAGLKATPELINDPAAFAKFQRAQSELGGALARLLVVAENYPQLKADGLFTAASIRKFQEAFPRFKKTGEVRDIEMEMVRKDGTVLPVSLNATAIFDAAGEYVSSRITTHDIGERVMLKHEQMRHAKRLKNLSHRLIAVQEEERRRLATELHDRASPNLAAIKITLATLSGSLPPQMQADVAPHLGDALALLDDTTAGIRDICADLRPAILDYSGLIPALEAYAVQFMKRTAITVRVKVPQADQIRLGKHEESALFRIVQEALMNCAKHACASTVDIELAKTNGQTTLTIKDNGFGFAAATTERPNRRSGLGLITMKERTEFMGGKLIVTSLPLWGTEIRVTLANRRAPQLRTRTAPLGLDSHPLYSGPGQTMSN